MGTGGDIWRGEQVPEKQGVKCPVPRAPVGWGVAFPYSSLSPSLCCAIANDSWPLWSSAHVEGPRGGPLHFVL